MVPHTLKAGLSHHLVPNMSIISYPDIPSIGPHLILNALNLTRLSELAVDFKSEEIFIINFSPLYFHLSLETLLRMWFLSHLAILQGRAYYVYYLGKEMEIQKY